MRSTGYIKNGKYIKSSKVPLDKMVLPQQTTYKQSDFAKQRFDHSAEILQPYDRYGKPNPKFIEASPEAAAEYGFIPSNRTDPRKDYTPDYYPEVKNGNRG